MLRSLIQLSSPSHWAKIAKLSSTGDVPSYCKASVTLDIASGGGWEPIDRQVLSHSSLLREREEERTVIFINMIDLSEVMYIKCTM